MEQLNSEKKFLKVIFKIDEMKKNSRAVGMRNQKIVSLDASIGIHQFKLHGLIGYFNSSNCKLNHLSDITWLHAYSWPVKTGKLDRPF